MSKLCAVYNVCGIGGRDTQVLTYYIDCIRSLLSQDIFGGPGDDYKIAISGCMSSDPVQQTLQLLTFGEHLSYNWIEEPLPLSVTFNDTVDHMVKHFGPFDGYLYVDSGISFWDPSGRYDALKNLWDVHQNGPYAITAAMPSNDDGSSWWGIQYRPDEDYVFPVGKATNMHCQIFSE